MKSSMKKTTFRLTAILLVIATILSLSVTAFAAKSVSSVSCQPNDSNGGKSSFFYIKANGTSCKLKFILTQGFLNFGNIFGRNVYGTYQIKIQKWDASKKCATGSLVLDQDIYKSAPIPNITTTFTTKTFKTTRGSYYRVQVYFWRATTTADSYYRNYGYGGTNAYFTPDKPNTDEAAYWATMPAIKAQNASNCTLYASCP